MKTREIQSFGFEPMVTKDRRLVFVLPIAQISDAGVVAITKGQLAEIMRGNIEDARKSLDKLEKQIAGESAAPAA